MRKNVIKFVFWNVKGKQSNIDLLLKYAHANNIDIVAICEAPECIADIEWSEYSAVAHIDEITNTEIQVFVNGRFSVNYRKEAVRFCLLNILCMDAKYRINFAVVHLNSQLTQNWEQYHQADIMSLKDDIANLENKHGKNTVIVGDFNENVFDNSICSFCGLNARFFKFLLNKRVVRMHRAAQDLYYNPMLKIYCDCDNKKTPKGTYFYDNNNDTVRWYCYDQLLLKYPLVRKFNTSSLKVLNSLSGIDLIENNKPKEAYSDHVPLYFEIKL